MRVTIDIPDELHQAAKARAALEGRSLRALFLEGLELALHRPRAQTFSTLPAATFVRFINSETRSQRIT